MRDYFNVEIFAGKHLAVQTEFNLFVRVYIDGLGLTVNEVLACLGIIKMLACGVNWEQTQESGKGGSLAVTDLYQTVIILGTG